MFRFVLVNHVRGGGNFQYLQRHVTRHQGNVTKLNTSQKFEKEVFGMNYCTPFFFWIKAGAGRPRFVHRCACAAAARRVFVHRLCSGAVVSALRGIISAVLLHLARNPFVAQSLQNKRTDSENAKMNNPGPQGGHGSVSLKQTPNLNTAT